jgi:hypothetical protein
MACIAVTCRAQQHSGPVRALVTAPRSPTQPHFAQRIATSQIYVGHRATSRGVARQMIKARRSLIFQGFRAKSTADKLRFGYPQFSEIHSDQYFHTEKAVKFDGIL